jgi:hypothetical protein
VQLDPNSFAYLQKPGNLYEQMDNLTNGLSANEKRLIYTTLIQSDKETANHDKILNCKSSKTDKFSVSAALKAAGPIINHYLSKKLSPDAHKVPNIKYHSGFMKTGGLRPNTKRLPVAVTEHLAYHASIAILLDALKLKNYPEAHAKMQEKFDQEKLHAREQVWDISTGNSEHTPPDYMPDLPEDAFAGVAIPAHAQIVPALVDVPLSANKGVQTRAAVAIHPGNGQCLSEFVDHTQKPPTKRYVVSAHTPPMHAAQSSVETRVFDDHQEATREWHKEPEAPSTTT